MNQPYLFDLVGFITFVCTIVTWIAVIAYWNKKAPEWGAERGKQVPQYQVGDLVKVNRFGDQYLGIVASKGTAEYGANYYLVVDERGFLIKAWPSKMILFDERLQKYQNKLSD